MIKAIKTHYLVLSFLAHLILFFTILFLFAEPAYSQGTQVCGPEAGMKKKLKTEYQEELIIKLQRTDGVWIEVWGNHQSGSWTAFQVLGDGIACVMTVGKHFEAMPMGLSL